MAQRTIIISQDYGGAEGYTCSLTDEYLPNYFRKLGFNEDVTEDILSQVKAEFGDKNISLLTSMLVESEFQGKGLGKQLLQDFIDIAAVQGSACVLLVADLDQSQRDGFKLSTFYRSSGFVETDFFYEFGLMIKRLCLH